MLYNLDFNNFFSKLKFNNLTEIYTMLLKYAFAIFLIILCYAFLFQKLKKIGMKHKLLLILKIIYIALGLSFIYFYFNFYFLILSILMIIFILICNYFDKQFSTEEVKLYTFHELKDMFGESFNIIEFNNMVLNKYRNLCKCYTNFNYGGMKSELSDELFDKFKNELEKLKEKNEKSIIDNIQPIKIGIIKYEVDNIYKKYEIYFKIRCLTLIINEKSGNIVKGDKMLKECTYNLSIYENILGRCQQCGANIPGLSQCPYCNNLANETESTLKFFAIKLVDVKKI